jgi:hypothetical protein
MRAIALRKQDPHFKDTSRLAANQHLPEILRPKQHGLTDVEYEVYKDFECVPDYFLKEIEMNQRPQVNYSNESLEDLLAKFFTCLENMEISNQQEETFQDLNMEVIKRLQAPSEAEASKTKFEFFKKLFKSLCEKYKRHPLDNQYLKYMKELLPACPLKISVSLVNELFGNELFLNEDFTLFVLSNTIIDIEEWAKRIAILFTDPNQLSDESFITFISNFIQKGLIDSQTFNTYDIFPIYTQLK